MKIFLSLTTMVILPFLLNAQTVNGQFTTVINVPTYEVTISTQMQSGTGSAGVVSIEFTFNDADLSLPPVPLNGTDYILHGDFANYVTKNITRPSADAVRISLITTGTPPPVPLSTTPTPIITIYFDITNQLGSSILEWTQTDIAPQFLQPNYAVGNWPNLNETPLPVELSSFSGQCIEESKIELDWETTTEVDNYGFEVERKGENGEWVKLGFVEGSGNTNSPKAYNYIDKNPIGGSLFTYRLKQIDTDGDIEYSDIVEVEIVPLKYELYHNYPNPFNPETKIKFAVPEKTKLSIRIYSILGELVNELINNKDYDPGFYKIDFNAIGFASGVYLFTIESPKFTDVKKMMLLK